MSSTPGPTTVPGGLATARMASRIAVESVVELALAAARAIRNRSVVGLVDEGILRRLPAMGSSVSAKERL